MHIYVWAFSSFIFTRVCVCVRVAVGGQRAEGAARCRAPAAGAAAPETSTGAAGC